MTPGRYIAQEQRNRRHSRLFFLGGGDDQGAYSVLLSGIYGVVGGVVAVEGIDGIDGVDGSRVAVAVESAVGDLGVLR